MLQAWLISFRDRLLGLGARLETTLPVTCEVWSHSLGECTAYDGYTTGLECRLHHPREGDPDRLLLEVQFRAMSSAPVLEKAKLEWGGFGHQAMPFKAPVKTPQLCVQMLLDDIDAFFPRFEAMLARAVSGGVKKRPGAGGCMVGMAGGEEPLPIPADASECEVWEGCFQSLFGAISGEPVLLSLRGMLVPALEMLPGLNESLPGLREETCWDFIGRNQQVAVPPTGFQIGGRSTVMEELRFDPKRGMREFFQRYPRTPGFFSFSRPGLDQDQALLAVTRMDCLYHESRPKGDPILSAYFWALCLLERVGQTWSVSRWIDWESLPQHPQAEEIFKERLSEMLRGALAEGGWEVCKAEEERLRLRGPSGTFVTVVTTSYLRDELIGHVDREPNRNFFLCRDPVLIVPSLHPDMILERLR